MNLLEGARIGWLEIKTHKLRAFLTLFGIAVGIASVVAMTGMLAGFQRGMRKGVQRLGFGRLFIFGRETDDSTNRSQGLLYKDALSIREHFPALRSVSPVASKEVPFFYRDLSVKAMVSGVVPDWTKLDWNYKLRGRFIDQEDLKSFSQVCVLIERLRAGSRESSGDWSQQDPLAPVFKRYDPLHQVVRLGQTGFRVVGVLKELPKDDDMDAGGDNPPEVLLPITSFQKRLSLERKQIDRIDLDSGDEASSYRFAKRVFSLLKRRHRDVEDFQVMNIADFMGPMLSWMNMATAVMGAVAAISLFAGGVGIMNITLASVNARVKEIGVRKSVGAKDKDIRLQFLTEAVLLSLSGGVLGVGIGLGICLLVKSATRMTVVISPLYLLGALAVSAAVGIAFSWYPARRASRLDPMEALRYE